MMKVIIAGSRSIQSLSVVKKAIESSGWEQVITEVVSGNAIGVDKLGEMWAVRRGIPVKKFLAGWEKYGKRAGYIRNKEMAVYGDALILVHDGVSKGSIDMLHQMKNLDKPTHVYTYLSPLINNFISNYAEDSY